MNTQEIYLRYTSSATGKFDIRSHWVWDSEKFFTTQIHNGSKEKPPVIVTLSTMDEYIRYKRS